MKKKKIPKMRKVFLYFGASKFKYVPQRSIGCFSLLLCALLHPSSATYPAIVLTLSLFVRQRTWPTMLASWRKADGNASFSHRFLPLLSFFRKHFITLSLTRPLFIFFTTLFNTLIMYVYVKNIMTIKENNEKLGCFVLRIEKKKKKNSELEENEK